MARPVANNKDVYQSYMLSTARYDFSVYEKRIIYRLVEMAQSELQGQDFIGTRIKTNSAGDKDIEMPVRYILANEEDKNYAVARKAFKSLANRTIEQTQGNVWYLDHMLERVRVDANTGMARFRVSPNVWNIILDFTKGYRKYELKTTMQFKSVYSMRMYELMSGQVTPISYGLDELKKMLCVEKYKNTPDFERKVLDTAKKELDRCSPYTFTYERKTVPSRGRGGVKTIGYTFFPHKLGKNRDPELEAKSITPKVSTMGMFGTLDKRVQDYLMHNIGIDKAAANKNKETLNRAQELFGAEGMIDKLAAVIPRLRKVSNPIGYVINALKSEIAAEEKKRRGVANVAKSV